MYKLKELKIIASNYSVLYVEDDENIANQFKNYLEKIFKKVVYKKNGLEGLESYKKNKYDLVITDVKMPIMDGLEMSEKIKEIKEEQNILITSAYSDTNKFIKSIKMGIDGYIIKPIDYNNLNSILYKIINKLQKFKEHAIYEKSLENLVKEKTNDNLKLSLEKVDNYEKTLVALIDIIESRDTYTGRHSLRVAEYSKKIAQKLKFPENECEELYRAGILHDIGKIAIPDSLLLKPSRLNENEYNLIKEHVNIGFHMLKQIPMFAEIAQIINCHHERVDGSGYPNGLKGDEIPLKANIMALADSFDAMTTSRIYKGRKEISEALEEIKSLSNIHFKEEVVEAAVDVLQDIKIDTTITQLPQTVLEEERFSYFYKDSLTEVFNEKYLDFILTKNSFDNKFKDLDIIFMENFSTYNKNLGWSKGNNLLKEISFKLSSMFEESIIFRIHGDDFVILDENGSPIKQTLLDDLQNLLQDKNSNITICHKKINIEENKVTSYLKLEKIL